MHSARIKWASMAFLFVFTVSTPYAADSKAAAKPATVTVVGTLIKGVECQALREDKTSKVFTLTPRPKGFKNGQHVTVSGTVVEISPCQQGTTIAVKTIKKAK
jgi:hypothetical protein